MDSQSVLEFGNNVFDDGLVFFLLHVVTILIIAHIVTRLVARAGKNAKRFESSRTTFAYIEKIIKAIVYIVAILSIFSKIKFLDG